MADATTAPMHVWAANGGPSPPTAESNSARMSLEPERQFVRVLDVDVWSRLRRHESRRFRLGGNGCRHRDGRLDRRQDAGQAVFAVEGANLLFGEVGVVLQRVDDAVAALEQAL